MRTTYLIHCANNIVRSGKVVVVRIPGLNQEAETMWSIVPEADSSSKLPFPGKWRVISSHRLLRVQAVVRRVRSRLLRGLRMGTVSL
jgi:hypothetical protein